MTGNLNLGAAVRIDATHMTVNGNPLLALNGALTVNGSLLLENSDSVSWSAGTYNLINATGGITGDLAGFFLQLCELAVVLGAAVGMRLEVFG